MRPLEVKKVSNSGSGLNFHYQTRPNTTSAQESSLYHIGLISARIKIIHSDAGTGEPGGPLADQLTLFEPGREDYPHLLLSAGSTLIFKSVQSREFGQIFWSKPP